MTTEIKQHDTRLTRLGTSETACRASSGNYRACAMIGNVIYQIGNDISDLDLAFSHCKKYDRDDIAGTQIFDDKGIEQIVRGVLESPAEPDEEDSFGGQPYRNEVPPVQWQKLH